MTVYVTAEKLQEALDLLNDLEKRRKGILDNTRNLGVVLGLEPVQVEAVVDAAYEAATVHLFHCMMKFRASYEEEHARTQSEGS